MAPRSMWNGTLAFGEVIFPVKLYSIVQERRVRFREVHLSDGGRIVHQRIGSESGQEVPGDRVAKAYELEDGNQVLLEDEEIAAARTGAGSKTIEIAEFVIGEQIDPIYYDRPYVIGAQPGGEHAYRVLLAALEKTGKVGIGRVVLRTREQLVALAPHEQALRMYTMRFADELVPRAELDVPALGREPSDRELDMAERLVETLEQTWEPKRHEDRHREAVMALIEQKAAGEAIEAPVATQARETPDLIAALEQSLKGAGARHRRREAEPGAGAKRATGAGANPSSRSRARSH